EGSAITMREHVGDGKGVILFTRVKAVLEGGSIVAGGDSLRIENANSVTLFLTAATNYRGENPEATTAAQMESVSGKNYEQLKRTHVEDYQQYFYRVDFDLGATDEVYFITDARIDAMKKGNTDPHLVQLYYQFGMYLLISSSLPGSLPANLQG